MVNATDTVARLPPEILAMVFEQAFWLCDGDRSRSKTRAYLGATCSRWRNVALTSRILWSSIYLHTAFGSLWPDIIDRSLERSGTSSLTVTIVEKRTYSKTSISGIDTRLSTIFPRTRVFRAWCFSHTLFALKICLSTPTPELQDFNASAMNVPPGFSLPFFAAAPKLNVIKWSGFRFHFLGLLPIPTLARVSLEMRELDELLDIVQRAPHIEKAILRVHAILPPQPLVIPSLLNLQLTCPDAAYVPNLHSRALKTAGIKLTRPGIVDLHGLAAFARRHGRRLHELSLCFAGDFSRLAAVLARCTELRTLKLGEIGWSTGFVASFLRDMATPDENGEWVCGRLEALELRVVQLESAVRTALMKLAEARRADARPEGPLRSITVVRSDNAVDTGRRNNYVALNKRLGDILAPQSA